MKIKKILIIVFLLCLSSFVYAGSIVWDDEFNFNTGVYTDTLYHDDGVTLNNTFSGVYCSDIEYLGFDNYTTWDNVSFIINDSDLLLEVVGEALPNLQGIDETANMTDNILLYHFDESTGAVIDRSSKNHHGTRENGVLVEQEGIFSYAYGFDDDDDYIDVPNLPEIKQAFTINLWAKAETNNMLINPMLFDFWDDTNDGTFLQFYTYKIRFKRNTPALVSNTLLYENTWYMVSATTDGNNAYIYINGQLDGSTSSPQNIAVTSHARIGQNRLNELNQFNGLMDEVAVWNRTLSQNELELIYNRTAITHNISINRSINLSVRSCKTPTCTGENFTSIPNTTPQDLNINNGSYFQFCADFNTTNVYYSPVLNEFVVYFSPFNVTINPLLCNFPTDITLMFMDYPYIEKDVSTVLGWRITKKNNPDMVVTDISTARINIDGTFYNLTYNPDTYNHEVTLLFNDSGDYKTEYPYRLYLSEDLSDLCSFAWFNGNFRVRDFGNLTINIYENANKSNTFNEDFSNIIIEVVNSEKLESDIFKSLIVPFDIVNNWFDYLALKTFGITLNIGDEDEYILNDEKVFHSELNDGQAVLYVPLEEQLIIKILGVKTSEDLIYTNDGYSYMFYPPQNIRYDTDLTTLTLNSSTIIDISINQKDVNPNWYYFKIILIVAGVLVIVGLPYLVYLTTQDYAQAMKFFTALMVGIPPIITVIIIVGGFLK